MERPLTAEEVQRLTEAAWQAREKSYAPYSHYPVGAALLAADGSLFLGCNVENVSYPAGLCAERNAIGSAVAAGKRQFLAIAVAGSHDTVTMPCGICLQVLAEFHVPYVICGSGPADIHVYALADLLPHGFDTL